MQRATAFAGLVLAAALLCGVPQAPGIEELSVEEDISDLLPAGDQMNVPENAATRHWAILPQLGYGPASGPVVGAKYTHRNLLHSGITFDVDGTYAVLNHQEGFGLYAAQPHWLNDQLLAVLRFKFASDPQRDFFGLGNNEQGPDPASTNSFQDIFGTLTLGWRPFQSLALNLAVGTRKVNIGQGKRLDSCGSFSPCPFTVDAFPDLPGVHGGVANTIAGSLVWNNRDSIVRPTRGWRGILKVIHTNKSFGSDFEFTRYIADLSYLRAFVDQRYIFGFRADGEWVAGPNGQVPYWELAELGGEDTMRGFFPHRFVGQGRVLLNGELRFLITEFDFFDLWHLKFDGVVFGDGGRVYLNQSEAKNEFQLNAQIFERIIGNFRYSYGGGLRIAIGQALVARIDAGFSDEEKGLIYLSFGQTF